MRQRVRLQAAVWRLAVPDVLHSRLHGTPVRKETRGKHLR